MNRKYKKLLVLSLIVFPIIISSLMFSISGEAWLNHRHRGADTKYPEFDEYKADYDRSHLNSKSYYYGTHDYIAECALQLLHEVYPSDEFIAKLMDKNDLKMYFLWATEFPDRQVLEFTTDCGTVITNNQFPYDHHKLRFRPEGVMSEDYLARYADAMYDEVIAIFQGTSKISEDRDCQAAAIYLGAMCHYIADSTFFSHLIPNPDASNMAICRTKVCQLTLRKYSDWPTDRGGAFFSIQSARDEFYYGQPEDNKEEAYYATFFAGWDAYSGIKSAHPDAAFASISRTNIKDAQWLDATDFPSIGSPPIDEFNWRANDWASLSSDDYDYMFTIQHHLNLAIYYSAAAMNQALDYYDSCASCKDEEEGESTQASSVRYLQYNLLFAILTLSSLFASISALALFGLSSKLK